MHLWARIYISQMFINNRYKILNQQHEIEIRYKNLQKNTQTRQIKKQKSCTKDDLNFQASSQHNSLKIRKLHDNGYQIKEVTITII